MKLSRYLIAWILFAGLLQACTKDKHVTSDGNWLFPIVKGDLSLTALKQLKDRVYTVAIPPLSIGQPTGVVVSSPGLQIAHVGPFPIEITPWLHRIDVDSLEIAVSLNNFFPVPIGAGTSISVRNTRDTVGNSNVVARIPVVSDIAPGALFSFSIDVTNKTLYDSVYFVLDDFRSPPYNNVTFSTTPTTLTAQVKVISAGFIQVYSNKTFSSVDTSEFSASDQIESGTSGAANDTSLAGYLNVFLDNALPASATAQIYFLNDNKTQVVDSLFTSTLRVTGINTDASGAPLSVNSTVTKVPVSRRRLENIKQSKYAVSRVSLNTMGYTTPWVSANRSARLGVQLTGDLNIKIRF